MSAMASQISSLMIVYSTIYSRRRSMKTSKLWWPVNSPHKWPVTRKMFPFDDVIMKLPVSWCYSTIHLQQWTLGLYSLNGKMSYCRVCEASKPSDWMLQWSYHSEFCQTSWQLCCQGVWQISESLEKSKRKSRGFDTSQNHAVRCLSTWCGGAYVNTMVPEPAS